MFCREVCYKESINTLRYQMWMSWIQEKTPIERAAQHALGTKAWKEHPVPLPILTEFLIERFEHNRALWDAADHSRDGGKRARLLTYGAVAPKPGNSLPQELQECWDCGLVGHRRGEYVCRTPGAMKGKYCPAWLKHKVGKQP